MSSYCVIHKTNSLAGLTRQPPPEAVFVALGTPRCLGQRAYMLPSLVAPIAHRSISSASRCKQWLIVKESVLRIDLVLPMVNPVRYVGPYLHLRPIRDPLQGHRGLPPQPTHVLRF